MPQQKAPPPPSPQLQQFIRAVQAAAVQGGFPAFIVSVRDVNGEARLFGKNAEDLKPAIAMQLGFEDAAEAEWPRHG